MNLLFCTVSRNLCIAIILIEAKNGPAKAGPRKKSLALTEIMQYNRLKANKMGRTRRVRTSPRPYAGEAPSHTADFLRHPHYNVIFRVLQGNSLMGLCAVSGCAGILHTCTALLFVSTGNTPGLGSPHPRGHLSGRQRTALFKIRSGKAK